MTTVRYGTLLSQQHQLIFKIKFALLKCFERFVIAADEDFLRKLQQNLTDSRKPVPLHNLVKLSFYVLLATQG